ncbi:hypothetical protein H2201_002200 [Coniosporium apollinis]|uniref:Uncharacterized protein n=2 Tax=Coniosporium TaxID=2810619 RepID=A0ABQ9NZ70_9PEZI|nr:hypothetical protein H2199_005634 [Cladosporium sp. JES 115]KAJ9667665.1 hypothetical protein H2201_002200 [Coniosporium apollinis]
MSSVDGGHGAPSSNAATSGPPTYDTSERFTAAGRPFHPEYNPSTTAPNPVPVEAEPGKQGSKYAHWGHWRFTDSDIIAVPVKVPRDKTSFKGKAAAFGALLQGEPTDYELKTISMTRKEYLEHYAVDAEGKYIGTGPPGYGFEGQGVVFDQDLKDVDTAGRKKNRSRDIFLNNDTILPGWVCDLGNKQLEKRDERRRSRSRNGTAEGQQRTRNSAGAGGA